jgi:hypothetical protein
MSRKNDSAKALLDDLISATKAATGYPEEHVRQFIEPAMSYLLREYGGDRLPKLEQKGYPVSDILAALSRGTSKREVCKRYRISRTTLFRIITQAIAAETGMHKSCFMSRNC